LTKRSLGTPEAVEAVAQRWKIARRAIAYGGLKDRHALTRQWLTIDHGPRRDLRQTNLELAYVGQTGRPFTAADIAANAFQIVLRNLSAEEATQACQTLQSVARDGVPNYFDQQRFGSVGQSREFIARAWCQGDYPRALWLAMADANRHDRPGDKRQKQLLREHWGRWAECRAAVGRGPWQQVLAHLAEHPDDYRGAIARIRPDLRSLYLAAFQGFLWNRMLSTLLREQCPAEQLFQVFWGVDTVAFYRSLGDAQRRAIADTHLPLPSARVRLEDGPTRELVGRTLGRLDLRLDDLRIDYPRDSFFSKGQRAAVFFPAGLELAADDDEVYPARRKIDLRFELPRGCYATILLRRLSEG
jgi:tRNA pseudouridine13 synthase